MKSTRLRSSLLSLSMFFDMPLKWYQRLYCIHDSIIYAEILHSITISVRVCRQLLALQFDAVYENLFNSKYLYCGSKITLLSSGGFICQSSIPEPWQMGQGSSRPSKTYIGPCIVPIPRQRRQGFLKWPVVVSSISSEGDLFSWITLSSSELASPVLP